MWMQSLVSEQRDRVSCEQLLVSKLCTIQGGNELWERGILTICRLLSHQVTASALTPSSVFIILKTFRKTAIKIPAPYFRVGKHTYGDSGIC